jgi:serine/threonine protein kinase
VSAKFQNTPLSPGSRLSRYTIQRRLSAGGFGVVYLAQRQDGRLVAIKEFLPTVIACRQPSDRGHINLRMPTQEGRFRDGLEAFFREADILSKINDPRVIQVWDVFEANGTAYFAMPLEKGGTLQAAIRATKRPMEDAELRRIFIEACMGVEALHTAGLLHLDIKPSNLWLRPDGSVVVLDLGASRWEDEEGRVAHLARTPGFAAPEQHGARRTRGLTTRTDIYGMASTLYAAIERRPALPAPERRPEDTTMAERRLGQRSHALLSVIDRGMALLPGDRYASIGQMCHALERVVRPAPWTAMAPGACLRTNL